MKLLGRKKLLIEIGTEMIFYRGIDDINKTEDRMPDRTTIIFNQTSFESVPALSKWPMLFQL
jgi:3-keto-L-gulonate-6-phosphate decarboxylase